VRVKICGITTVEDAVAAAEAGADAIGLNFVGGPRRIAPEVAQEILEALPPMVAPVVLARLQAGVLPDDVLGLLGQYWVSHVQIYGDFTADSLALLRRDGFRPMPVVRVRDPNFAGQAYEMLGGRPLDVAAAVVLDTYDSGKAGGTGASFNWEWVSAARQAGLLHGWPVIILAGGLRLENVAEAVRVARPYGVDVASGVEVDGQLGRKDPEKMMAFVRAARSALDREGA